MTRCSKQTLITPAEKNQSKLVYIQIVEKWLNLGKNDIHVTSTMPRQHTYNLSKTTDKTHNIFLAFSFNYRYRTIFMIRVRGAGPNFGHG